MVSHTAGADWQSFELRMRRRCAERLVLRADAAADAGCPDDARSCLEEARALAPGLPQLALIEAKLSHPPRRPLAPFLKWSVYAAACVGAMIAGAAMTRMAPAPAVPAVPSLIAAHPLAHDVRLSAPPAPARVVPEASPAPLRATEPQRDTAVTAVAANKLLPPVRRMDAPARAERAGLTALAASPMPPEVPAVPLDLGTMPSAAPVAEASPSEASQDSVVRTLLNRYASAYSALDADAAQRVWPGVNRAALSRAFDGLASQQISLGDCRIDVAAASARAVCAGSATWAPKVGDGASRTEARDWTFALARAATGWQIVSARVQNR